MLFGIWKPLRRRFEWVRHHRRLSAALLSALFLSGLIPYLVFAVTCTAPTTIFLNHVGIGTTTPGSLLSLNNIANFDTATSSFYSTGGINIAAGCFSINGTCVGGGGGSVGALAFSNATATCPSGYSVTGGGISGGSTYTNISGNGWLCNASSAATGFTCTAICAKVQ